MCGISGIILEGGLVNKERLKVMNDCVQHRGPDAEGFYLWENIGFGHRRLSILDLTEGGAQPMHYAGDYTITYNGEVYNYIELRTVLLQKGYVFSGNSDTEVILAAYQEYGFDCVNHFNGMWAFAIHDRKKNIVFISRDRFGVKPLYYHYSKDQNALFFGSEIRQILTQLKEIKVNEQVLFDYLYLGYHHHTEFTFFDGIRSLDAGHNMVVDVGSGKHVISRWYTLKVNHLVQNLSFDEAQKLFEETIDRAIRLRLRSDVKVGTCLSGGLDSSYIATIAGKAYNLESSERFTAITAKSLQKENDESPFAKMVADYANLDWKVTFPQKEDFLRVLDDVVESQQEPFGGPSIIMQYFVMQKAKQEGCTVLLDGQGGDEGLLGYDRYYAAYLNQQRGIINKIKSYLTITKNSKLGFKELFLYSLYFNNSFVRARRQARRAHFIKREYKKYLNVDLLSTLSEAGKNLTDLQMLEITKTQLQKLLTYEDRNAMRFSIETRVPFVDFHVIELALSLPFSFKLHDGWSKYILRKTAQKKLPDEIVWRKTKIGFEAPKDWFINKQALFDTIKASEFLQHYIHPQKISKNIDDASLWRLFNVALWAKKFNVNPQN